MGGSSALGAGPPSSRGLERALEKLRHSKQVHAAALARRSLAPGSEAAGGGGLATTKAAVAGPGSAPAGGSTAAASEREEEEALVLAAGEPATYSGPGVHDSFEEACARGDWVFVEQCLQGSKDGGQRLLTKNWRCLHEACWNGRARLVLKLLRFANAQLVNRRDASGTTPLMEVARSRNSPATARLAILKMLLARGADVDIADRNGDSFVHVLARNHDALLLRASIAKAPSAVLLLDATNAQGRTPRQVGQVAQARGRTPAGDGQFVALLTSLSSLQADPASELWASARREREAQQTDKRRGALERDLLASAAEDASVHGGRVAKLCNDRHLAAEALRQKAERDFVATALGAAEAQTAEWLAGPYGSSELKLLTRSIRKDLKDHPTKDNKQADAKQRATDTLVRRKQNEAKTKALADFRTHRPPYSGVSE